MNNHQINEILALGAQQHGLFSVSQADSVGVTQEQLQAAIKRGWLRRLRRSVLVIAGTPVSEYQPLMAALLAAGSRSVVSHYSAAVLHGFHGVVAPTIELSTAGPAHPRLTGVRVHRTATLLRRDVQVVQGLRATSPVRTVIDLAPRLSPHLLAEILDEGAISRLWTPRQVETRYSQLIHGRPSSALPALLQIRLDEGALRSRLEQRVCRVLEPVAPPFRVNHIETVGGFPFEMDLAWCDQKIDGEVDGWRVRAASRSKFERQCRRENILQAHGWRIVHFTHEMDDRTIIDQIVALLSS